MNKLGFGRTFRGLSLSVKVGCKCSTFGCCKLPICDPRSSMALIPRGFSHRAGRMGRAVRTGVKIRSGRSTPINCLLSLKCAGFSRGCTLDGRRSKPARRAFSMGFSLGTHFNNRRHVKLKKGMRCFGCDLPAVNKRRCLRFRGRTRTALSPCCGISKSG